MIKDYKGKKRHHSLSDHIHLMVYKSFLEIFVKRIILKLFIFRNFSLFQPMVQIILISRKLSVLFFLNFRMIRHEHYTFFLLETFPIESILIDDSCFNDIWRKWFPD